MEPAMTLVADRLHAIPLARNKFSSETRDGPGSANAKPEYRVMATLSNITTAISTSANRYVVAFMSVILFEAPEPVHRHIGHRHGPSDP
jgi:hypothetical protein